jgi:protease I
MNDRLTGFRVAILATDLFEESELIEPRKALIEDGATTFVIAPHPGEIQAVQHDTKTQKIKVDQVLTVADPEQFDALLIPGGAKNVAALRKDPLALEFVRHIDQTHRPIAVICHGGWLLASALLVKGRHMTSYPAIQNDLRKAGAFWTDKEVVLDGNWVSSRKPSDIPHFNEAMLNLFFEHKVRSRVAA